MGNKRLEERNSCYMRAEIIYDVTKPPLKAEVHDISDHGLRLRMPNTNGLPDRFVVVIPRRKMRETVIVRHRTVDSLGCIIQRLGERVA